MRFWKIYSVILTVIVLLTIPDILRAPSELRLIYLLDLMSTILVLAGLVAFAWRRRLLSRDFWRIFAPLQLFWSIYFAFFIPIPPEMLKEIGSIPQWLAAIMNLAIVTPVYLGLYLYAFKDAFPWDGSAGPELTDAAVRETMQSVSPEGIVESPELREFISIRPSWYQENFRVFPLDKDGDPGFAPTWNWPAAIFGPFWLLYRKMWLPGVILLFIGPATILSVGASAVLPESEDITSLLDLLWFLLERIGYGLVGNYVYFWHIKESLTDLHRRHGELIPEEAMRKKGGASLVGPFIVLGILIVFVILIGLALFALLSTGAVSESFLDEW